MWRVRFHIRRNTFTHIRGSYPSCTLFSFITLCRPITSLTWVYNKCRNSFFFQIGCPLSNQPVHLHQHPTERRNSVSPTCSRRLSKQNKYFPVLAFQIQLQWIQVHSRAPLSSCLYHVESVEEMCEATERLRPPVSRDLIEIYQGYWFSTLLISYDAHPFN